MRWGAKVAGIGVSVALAVGVGSAARAVPPAGPACTPGGAPITVDGSMSAEDAKTYRTIPFEVASGTTRVEVGYRWDDVRPMPGSPLVQTVVDLGLWDEDGVGTPEGFRGWSGSRQGKTALGQPPVWVQADSAERGYRPGPVEPGIWNVDLGIAAVAPAGATYQVTIRCLGAPVGSAFVARPVDTAYVANAQPGWYHGDFHMHGVHSSPEAPPWMAEAALPSFIGFARKAGLDFLPVTDYVTDQHHRELGPVQLANPDLLVWPGREIITYFGHATVFGETPSVVDWRHGAGDLTLADIQEKSVDDGALFGVAHPTIFPTPIFGSFCRGCEFTLGDQIDWDQVSTLEVLTGPILVDDRQIRGGQGLGMQIENPFVATAIDLWEQKLAEGHRITAVSGSDDKLGPGLGSSATAVYAQQLSRSAIAAAVRAGHAYVRTLGAHTSPAIDVRATSLEGEDAIVGDSLETDLAFVTVRVTGARGQTALVSADGERVAAVPILTDDFTFPFVAARSQLSGPLGTFWRVDTQAPASSTTGPHLTTIGNPIFLTAP